MPTITNAMGLWLRISNVVGGDGLITTGITGDYSSSAVEITLYPGWNLVGYPSISEIDADITLGPTGADGIAEYQDTAPYISDEALADVFMEEGKAYWVHVPFLTTWNVAP